MRATALLLITVLITAQAMAYTKVERFKVSSPESRLREAARAGVGISNLEASEKRDVVRMKKNSPGRYKNTSEVPNKFVNEVEKGVGRIDPAKALAKLFILKAVENNWSRLRDSAFLDTPTENWTEAKRLMKNELDKIVLVETASKTHFRFQVPWASALVRKDLKDVTVTLTVANHLDGNQLPEGAADIQIPKDN